MSALFKQSKLNFEEAKTVPEPFRLHTAMPRLSSIVQSKHMIFDIRSLAPGKYSFPYHFHRFAEEMFVIFSGTATLRTPDGLKPVEKGDVIFFEEGETSAHQLYNDGQEPCVYLDIRTASGYDVTEYPDSDKINFFPNFGVFEKKSKVNYFQGEEGVDEIWGKLK